MRALLRWTLADLRTRRGQAASLVLATGGITAALLISVALLIYATNPWQRLFTDTRGAHITMHVDAHADTAALRALDEVNAVSGPFRTVSVIVRSGPDRA